MSAAPFRPHPIIILLLCAALAMPAHQAHAQPSGAPPPRITITEPLAWLRKGPGLTTGNVAPVVKGQFYDVLGRSADGLWWQIRAPGTQRPAWLFAPMGATYSGDITTAPVLTPSVKLPLVSGKLPALPRRLVVPAGMPVITERHRQWYRNSTRFGKDLGLFTVVGDCNSMPSVYVRRVANGDYDTSQLPLRLQAVVQRFERSFGRISLAAEGGFSAAAMMDPTWANSALCDVQRGVGPFACELWVSRASVVFIALGTQEQYTWQDFEKHYRPLVEHALEKGVLPVLVTKADDLETASGASPGYINDTIRRLAREYDVPLLDFYLATRDLPNFGLIDEGDKDFHLSRAGMDRRLLLTLLTLAALVE
ncbi:MAG: hypothetical protein ACK4WM_01145 [Thermoflexales bacterium]